MSLSQVSLSGLYVLALCLAHFIHLTGYPATPLAELTEISLSPSQVDCLAGCELQLSPLSSVRCLALPEQEQLLAGQERLKVRLGPVLFLCRPDPGLELAGNSKFEVDSLDCQFPDEAGYQVISSSCRLSFRLTLAEEAAGPLSPTGQGSDYGLRVFLAVLLVTLIFLALRDLIIANSTRPGAVIPLASQVVTDTKEMSETRGETERGRREEVRFRQNHSAIREKSRARSRSRKR